MDYDKTAMPDAYDRARAMRPENAEIWNRAFLEFVPSAKTIVDLGCGTGRFTDVLARLYGARTVGVDPSSKMLSQAEAKSVSPLVSFLMGAAENIPVEGGWADLVFASMAFHHFVNRELAVIEIKRVLHRGGFVMIRNSTRGEIMKSPYASVFPGFAGVANVHSPKVSDIRAAFVENGFVETGHHLVAHVMASNWYDLAEKAELRADSMLSRLDDEEFQRGIAEMRHRHNRGNSTAELSFPIDLLVFRAIH
jgi:ubiquinone/menaquinone biosynthesis C-methylase UbiE